MITQEYVVANYKYLEGHLYHKVRGPHRTVGARIGWYNSGGYVKVGIGAKEYGEHQLIYLMFHGELPDLIDHWDNNPGNNKLSNLRPATIAQNNQNSKVRVDNESGVKELIGVQ